MQRSEAQPRGEGTPPDLLVSIVSYHTPDLLAHCLDALDRERRASGLHVTVTVVDNAPGDGSADVVRARFPWAQLIQNQENVGFGRAHNQAVRAATARHLLVLNSDAALQAGALRTLVDYLDAHPDVAVVGPRVRYPNGTLQPARRRFPTPLTFFLESTQLERFWPHNPAVRHFRVFDEPEDVTQDVDWLVGACLFVRASAAADVGLLDERYFLYSEEVDWCLRFRAAGWRVVYLPSAEAVHLEGGSSRRDLLARDLHFHTSRIRYAERWFGRRLATLLRLYLLAEYTFRGAEEALKLVLGSRPHRRLERLRIVGGVLRHGLRA